MDSNDVPPLASPPPSFSPPPIMSAPQPMKPRKSRGWMIVAIVLLILLAFSLMGNFGQWIGHVIPGKGGHMGSARNRPQMDEIVTEDNNSDHKILVVDVTGIITSRSMEQGGLTMVEKIKEELKLAQEDHRVKAVVLRVDSPGGEVLASDEIYRLLMKFQEDTHKPVITSMGNLAASGGYYIAASSRWIVANEMTITGSIGVILHAWNYRGLMDKVGLVPQTYKSGAHKDMLSGERRPEEIPADEREMIQSLIDETYGRFKLIVEKGRGDAHTKNKAQGHALASDWKDYADGRVLSGKRAEQLGFVDEVGDFNAAVDRARALAAIPDADVIEYRLRYDFSDIFRMFGKSEAATIKVDLGMDAPKVEAGRLYFLSPSFLR